MQFYRTVPTLYVITKVLTTLLRVTTIVVTFSCVFLHTASGGEPFPAVAGLPASVTSVVTGGYWKEHGDRGRYRLWIEERGWEHLTSVLHIDWIAERSESKSLMIVESVVVGELSNSGVLSDVRLAKDQTGPIAKVAGMPSVAQSTPQNAIIELRGPGNYRVRGGKR